MIIWIASYPKSGNTWVRAFVNKIFLKEKFDLNKLGLVVEQFPKKSQFKNIINDYNDINQILDNSLLAQEKILEKNKIKFLKTHSLFYKLKNGKTFSNAKKTLGAIYIVRDPRNVFLSFKNHGSADNEEMKNIFFDDLRWIGKVFDGNENSNKDYSIKTLIGTWKSNLVSWRKSIDNLLLLKYENLILDPEKEFFKVINYLKQFTKIDISHNELINFITEINFKNLNKLEELNGFSESPFNNEKKVKFFFKGPKRNWEKELDKEIINKIEKEFYEEMKNYGYINI